MTVDELVQQMEERRTAKRFEWVAPRLSVESRGSLRLERVCGCHGCRHAHCYDFSEQHSEREWTRTNEIVSCETVGA
jgi:hypothetical protein